MAVESRVLEILRARGLFKIATEDHKQQLEHLRATCPIGPRGGRAPALREEEKTSRVLRELGPEAAFADLISKFSYAAERWLQMTDPDVTGAFPYVRYVCTRLPDSRSSHIEKSSLVFPLAHLFWDIWLPPNGLGCICTVSSESETSLQRDGRHVSDNRRFEFPVPDNGFDFNIGKLVARDLR